MPNDFEIADEITLDATSEQVWEAIATGPGVDITQGAAVRLNVPGLAAIDGVVEFLGKPHFVGVRTPHGIHLLVKGYRDMLVVGYHGFSDDEDEKRIESAWRAGCRCQR